MKPNGLRTNLFKAKSFADHYLQMKKTVSGNFSNFFDEARRSKVVVLIDWSCRAEAWDW
jgi:hypothetical protein